MNSNSRNPSTATHGTESKSVLVPKIWSVVPQEIRNCKSLDSFQKKGCGHQSAHAGYVKLTCNKLVLYKKMC